jgi:hypothetical protein
MTDVDRATVRPRLDLPEGWVEYAVQAPFVLGARPAAWRAPFVPSISVLVTTVAAGVTLGDYLAEQLLDASRLVDPVLVHVDGDPAEGRLTLLVAHAVEGRSFTTLQHHVVRGTGASTASATVVDVDWPLVADEVTRAVRSLHVAP